MHRLKVHAACSRLPGTYNIFQEAWRWHISGPPFFMLHTETAFLMFFSTVMVHLPSSLSGAKRLWENSQRPETGLPGPLSHALPLRSQGLDTDVLSHRNLGLYLSEQTSPQIMLQSLHVCSFYCSQVIICFPLMTTAVLLLMAAASWTLGR